MQPDTAGLPSVVWSELLLTLPSASTVNRIVSSPDRVSLPSQASSALRFFDASFSTTPAGSGATGGAILGSGAGVATTVGSSGCSSGFAAVIVGSTGFTVVAAFASAGLPVVEVAAAIVGS